MATDDTTTDGLVELPEQVVADLFASERRRFAVEILAERDGPMALDDLAAAVRARERGIEPAAVPDRERRSVRDAFFERHLPKLTATGVVEYDSMVATVALADDAVAGQHRP
ncbi:hypothetical protein ACAH01_07400 [Halomicrobium sp. HM KBTZ05]|uniref:DUF7344 domain-containing protein n=1 Tax=Halomicrobium mukohataei TaxID=57705 RepID=A0A847TY98_9EURY|nr:hypothetical protein [Halomicrobium mukohataei]NLV10962.1 hypothetical protein [Halomicrobium mukohataei]